MDRCCVIFHHSLNDPTPNVLSSILFLFSPRSAIHVEAKLLDAKGIYYLIEKSTIKNFRNPFTATFK